MYIVELCRNEDVLYLKSMTETSVELTDDWRRAERFPVHNLPKAADINTRLHAGRVVGYAPV